MNGGFAKLFASLTTSSYGRPAPVHLGTGKEQR